MRKIIVLSCLVLSLSGCATLVPNPGDPVKKFTLEAIQDKTPTYGDYSSKSHRHQLIVDLPSVYPPIDSTRIALRPNEQIIDYYADVEWADRLGILIQESLIYSLQNKGILRGVSRPTEGIHADFSLKVEVRKFFVDQKESTKEPVAQVEYMAYLVKLPERKIITSRQFTHSQTISEQSMDQIIKALNTAHLKVSKDLVPWVIDHVH
jgi:cholesterol transport system auxiliary component